MKNTLLILSTTLGLIFITKAQLAGSGKAFDFTNSYISVPNSATLSPSTGITLEAWIKADAYAANSWENVIISKDGWASGNQGYVLRTGANGILSFNFSSNGTWKEVVSSAVMSTGNWYHVAGTYDGATLRIYINGIEQNSLAFAGPITNGSYDINIGRAAYTIGGTRYFDGVIDEVKIWSSAISEASIREYMCKKVTSSHPQYANLGGYWNMDQTGSILDQSPNANNGTSTGAIQVNSGAAIGNTSVYSYLSIANLSLPFGTMDTAKVTSSTLLPLVQLYRVDAVPLVTASGTVDSIDQSHYYGVYVTPTPASSYSFAYHYGTNPLGTGNENYLILAARTMGSSLPWVASTSTQNQTLNTLTYAVSGRKEMILAIDCPSVNITPGNSQNLCAGENVVLSVLSGATNIQWYNGASPIAGATSPTLTITTTGMYHITANTGVCATTGPDVSVTVHAIPTVDFGDLPSNSFCGTDGLQTISNSIPLTGGTFSGPGIFNNTFTPNMAPIGVHTLYYNYSDAFGCSNVDSFIVTLGAPPAAPVITQTGLQLCTPACGTFTWSVGGTVISGATTNCYTATTNGNYSVFCTTPEGCVSSSASGVVGGIGLEEFSWANNVLLAPNPTNGFLTVSIPNETEGLICSIIDINGRFISGQKLLGTKISIDLSHYQRGIYFLSIENIEGSVTRKIIKE
jgi:hypothetical protein